MKATDFFQPSREDGRSDKQIIFDLASDAEPETLFSHDDLLSALADGLPAKPTRGRVYQAVASANSTLLNRSQRYLQSVRRRGYRVLRADEHVGVALIKKDSAQGYLRRGIELLRHARMEDLTETQRALHEGQLMIMVGFSNALRESSRRHERLETAVDDLRERVARLEQ